MPECPICLGAGEQDERDLDAMFEEHFSAEDLREMGHEPLGIRPCDECESTGVVSEDRLRDLMAGARAEMDQVIALYEEKHAGKPYVRDGLTAILERIEVQDADVRN